MKELLFSFLVIGVLASIESTISLISTARQKS